MRVVYEFDTAVFGDEQKIEFHSKAEDCYLLLCEFYKILEQVIKAPEDQKPTVMRLSESLTDEIKTLNLMAIKNYEKTK